MVGEDLPDLTRASPLSMRTSISISASRESCCRAVLPARNQHAGIASRQRASRHQRTHSFKRLSSVLQILFQNAHQAVIGTYIYVAPRAASAVTLREGKPAVMAVHGLCGDHRRRAAVERSGVDAALGDRMAFG